MMVNKFGQILSCFREKRYLGFTIE